MTEHDIKRERSSSPAVSSDSELSIRDSPSPAELDKTPSTSPIAAGQADMPAVPTALQPSTSSSLATLSQSTTMATSISSAAPAKKKRKTAAEREAEELERILKKAKRDEEAAAKAKEKEEKEAARAAKAAEKAAEKAKAAAEKAKATAEKEEKERKRQEEEDKKKRAQPSIFGFLKTKPAVLGDVSPNKQAASSPTAADSSPVRPKAPSASTNASPSKKAPVLEISAYARAFQPFFVKPDVKMAPKPFQMDDETILAKSQILDEYIRGKRPSVETKPFDPVSVFQFNGMPTPRGRQHVAVKKVMAEIFGDPLDGAPNSRTESQQVRFTSVQEQLSSIPVKVLSFWEDVRPPYIGTVTSAPKVKLQRLARRPAGRLLKLNYDYDSEAEWEEEEGEDLDEDEVEDEENDGDEEMGDFLDDAEDVAAARPAFLGESEPVSTGICFEDCKRLSHNGDGENCATVCKYRLEFLLGESYYVVAKRKTSLLTTTESLEHHHSIDPFSTEYWETKKTAPAATSCAQAKITSVIKSAKPAKTGMAPPPVPGASTPTSTAQPDWSVLVPKQVLPDFKRALVSTDINFLTKVGIVDMLSKRFPDVTKNQVKATLDFVAERTSLPGAKKSAKVWVLRSEHALDKD